MELVKSPVLTVTEIDDVGRHRARETSSASARHIYTHLALVNFVAYTLKKNHIETGMCRHSPTVII